MILRTASQNKETGQEGVTLVEVMISLVILLVVFVGLIQTSILSVEHNMRNSVRDGAVNEANETMTQLKSRDYSDPCLTDTLLAVVQPLPLVCNNTPGWTSVTRTVGNYPQGYAVGKTVTRLDPATDLSKQVIVQVRYTYRDDPEVRYSISSTIRQKPK